MPELILYLIKVNSGLVLFCLVYYLFLRRLTFYNLNRLYFLFAFLFSALYPLFNLQSWFPRVRELQMEVSQVVPTWGMPMATTEHHIWKYVVWIFWVIVSVFVVRFIVRLFSLWRIHLSSQPAKWKYFDFRHVVHSISPFSFWKSIYIHKDAHQEHELLEIFSHENIHVRQLHTVDMLLADIYSIFCWFNPACWLLRTAVRENLEFLTDRAVLKSGLDKESYQYSLLNLSSARSPGGLGNSFNFKLLKTRIRMMNKKNSSAFHLGKYLLMVPVITLVALMFSISQAEEPEVVRASSVIRVEGKFIEGDPPQVLIDGVKGDMHALSPNIIQSIEVIKGEAAVKSYGSDGINGVILITTKK